MKRFVIVSYCILLCGWMSAEELRGRVSDKLSNMPVPFATVTLLSSDSSLIDGGITDDEGAFRVSATKGQYILNVSYIGYSSVSMEVTIPYGEDLMIYLYEESKELEELEVKAKIPLVERQMDKIVLNVSQSAFANGSNGEDLLRKAPGVTIDKDGNITVNGKSVEVYIDGRPSYMSGDQLKNMLIGMNGSMVEKIEIITNPSAKYEASGQGGIVNIKMKKNLMRGLNGMISANYGGMYFKDFGKYFQEDMVSVNLNYRSAKTYTNLSLTQVYGEQGQSLVSTSSQPFAVGTERQTYRRESKSVFDVAFQYYQANVSNDWYVDDKNTLGFILKVPILKTKMASDSLCGSSRTWLGEELKNETKMLSRLDEYAPQHGANLNFTHVFADSLARELTANLDFNRYSAKGTNSIRNTAVLGIVPDDVDVMTKSVVNIYSGKVDFQTMFWKTGMLEAGLKYALSCTDNDMTTDSLINGMIRAEQNILFSYREHVAAAYISASKQFGKHFSAKVGLRGEYTYSFGDWISAESTTKKSYFNLFPTVFMGYNPTEKWSMDVSYSRRIRRPSYEQMNPFVTYVDAHTYMCGNTDLTPEFSHQVDVNFGWSRFVSLAFNFSHTVDMLNRRPFVLGNGDMKMTWVNFGNCTTHGGYLSFTEVPIVPKRDGEGNLDGAWLTLTLNGGYYHFTSRSKQNDYTYKSHWGRVSAVLTTYLPKDIQMSIDGYWSAPMTMGYNHQSSFWMMDFAFKKSFLQNRLIMTAQVQDLLRTAKWKLEMFGLGDEVTSENNSVSTMQSVSIGLTYMFGQQQWHKRRNVGNIDESSRLGSSAGTGVQGGLR